VVRFLQLIRLGEAGESKTDYVVDSRNIYHRCPSGSLGGLE
jgi:hypothetical protein